MLTDTDKLFFDTLSKRVSDYPMSDSDIERTINARFSARPNFNLRRAFNFYYRTLNKFTNKMIHIYRYENHPI